jgi:hypothetical protein
MMAWIGRVGARRSEKRANWKLDRRAFYHSPQALFADEPFGTDNRSNSVVCAFYVNLPAYVQVPVVENPLGSLG